MLSSRYVQVCFFYATTSNSTVKATGISSLLTADITYRTFDKVGLGFYTPEQVAQLLAVLSGLILAMLGVLRLGWLLRCIPKAATDAYATAVSVKLIITQLPVLLGIVGVSNEGSPFVILANVLRYLSESNVDIAFGIPSIVFLGCVAYACEFMTRRYPGQQRFWNLISTLRFPVVIALSILCSWLVYRGHYGGPIQTVGEIDPGTSIKFPKPPSATNEVVSAQAFYAPIFPWYLVLTSSRICGLNFLP